MAPKLNENRVPSKCLPLLLMDLRPSLLLFISLKARQTFIDKAMRGLSLHNSKIICRIVWGGGGGINDGRSAKLPGFIEHSRSGSLLYMYLCMLDFLLGGGEMDLVTGSDDTC